MTNNVSVMSGVLPQKEKKKAQKTDIHKRKQKKKPQVFVNSTH